MQECKLLIAPRNNSNLITIIGGKGSGKTAILDLTANCFEDRCYRKGKGAVEEKNSFVQRIELDNPDLEIEINFVGPVESFTKKITEDKLFKSGKVTYLPQGQIEDFSSNRERLNEKIKQVIFDNKQVKDANLKENFEKIDSEIKSINQEIEKTNLSIFSLERETTDDIVKGLSSELANTEGQLKNKNDELEALRANIKDGVQGKAQELRNSENALQEKKRNIEAFELEREVLKQEFQYSLPNINEKIKGLNAYLTIFEIENKIPDVDYKVQLEAIEKASTNLQHICVGILEEIKTVEEALSKLEGIEKAEAGILKEIDDIQQNIKSISDKIAEVAGKKTKIKELEDIRRSNFIALMCKFLEWRKFYKQVIETFSKESSKILNGVRFESSVHFDLYSFIRDGQEILNLSKVPEEEINRLSDLLKGLANRESEELIKADVTKFVSEVMTHKNQLKGKKTWLDFYNWVFKNYYSLDTNVSFNGIDMDRLSIGQKGTVLLKIFLAEGDYPLIVDMPEENLDNKFICDELKDAIRQAKKKRQIILATNNANLVINTDAEEVIVADYKDNVISYTIGSIEDKSIRDEITHILEGGREALIKREQKYGFQ